MDVAVAGNTARYRLYENRDEQGDSLQVVVAAADELDHTMLGTTVEVTIDGETQYWVQNARADYQSQHTRTLHFGFGDADTVDELRIRWPDSNPETHADPSWEPLAAGGSPEYTSTLAAYGGAACVILEDVLGSADYAFEIGENIRTGTTGEDAGVTRSFGEFEAALEESIDSRISVGNHFRFGPEDGREQGERLGE